MNSIKMDTVPSKLIIFVVVFTAIVCCFSTAVIVHSAMKQDSCISQECKTKYDCFKGLECHEQKCRIPIKPDPEPIHIYENRTEPCPSVPVTPKVVTYFDYNEHPNRWLDPGPRGFIKTVENISYGACKEICSSLNPCNAIGYKGDANFCGLIHSYLFPAYFNNTWTYAIKVRHT